MSETVHRVLLIKPETRVLAAAVGAGLEAWSVSDVAGGTPAAGGAPERQLTVNLENAAELHSLLVHTARVRGIPHVLYFGGSETLHLAVERVLMELSPRRADTLRTLHDPAAVRRILEQSGVSGGGHAEPRLVAESLTGPEITVDTYTFDGMHQVIGITAAQSAAPAGVDLLHPAALCESERTAVRATVRALLDLVGHESGPVHTRVILTGSGPRIASSCARPSRNPVSRLREIATGHAPGVDVLTALAGRALRKPGPPRFVALARLAPARPGRMPATALGDIRAMSHVHDLRPVAAGADTVQHVEVVVHGASPAEAAERLAVVRRRWESL